MSIQAEIETLQQLLEDLIVEQEELQEAGELEELLNKTFEIEKAEGALFRALMQETGQ